MNVFPSVLVLSEDVVLRELLAQLLRRDRFLVSSVGSLRDLRPAQIRADGVPSVILVDAIESETLAQRLLHEIEDVFGVSASAVLLLAGSATPASLVSHPDIAHVLRMPLSAEGLLQSIHNYACRPRAVAPAADSARATGVQVSRSRGLQAQATTRRRRVQEPGQESGVQIRLPVAGSAKASADQ